MHVSLARRALLLVLATVLLARAAPAPHAPPR